MNSRVEIRTLIRQKRKQLSITQQINASEQLTEQLCQHKKIQQAKHIALYLANDGELDTQHFINWCWQQKKCVYLPVIHPFQPGNLLFLRYEATTPLVKNQFNIDEPKLNVTQVCPLPQLDVLCTPLVAFDNTGARLGMGGGFYDRTLASWFSKQKQQSNSQDFYPLGLAHDCQQIDKVPTEIWDIPLPEIITPSQIFTTK